MAELVRPACRAAPSSGLRAVSLLPAVIFSAMMLGLALMAGDQGVDEPSALTIDAAALEHLAVDKTDLQDYPSWSKTVDDINAIPGLNHGLWAYYKGPPFLQRVTMYSGNDIDLTKSGELVRRIIGLPKNYGKWEGNHYLANFDSQQMYFLQSNQHSVLIFPPMKESHLPILSEHAIEMVHRYVSVGHNTLILTGGPGAVKFINDYLFTDGASIRSRQIRFALLPQRQQRPQHYPTRHRRSVSRRIPPPCPKAARSARFCSESHAARRGAHPRSLGGGIGAGSIRYRPQRPCQPARPSHPPVRLLPGCFRHSIKNGQAARSGSRRAAAGQPASVRIRLSKPMHPGPILRSSRTASRAAARERWRRVPPEGFRRRGSRSASH